jgi:hypothetical protein
MEESLENPLYVIGLAFAIFLILVWAKFYWKKRITHWAKTRGYFLIEYRGAMFFEGPGGMLRTDNQTAFKVKIRDSGGKIRSGWLVFGSYWNPFSPPDELLQKEWD